MAFSFSGARDRSNLSDQKTQILNIIQEARGLSLSSLLTEGEVTDYYELSVAENGVSLLAKTHEGERTEISSVDLKEGFQIQGERDIYYIPPYGDVCIEDIPPCDGTNTETSFTLTSLEGNGEVTFTITKYGGYPEVE